MMQVLLADCDEIAAFDYVGGAYVESAADRGCGAVAADYVGEFVVIEQCRVSRADTIKRQLQPRPASCNGCKEQVLPRLDFKPPSP